MRIVYRMESLGQLLEVYEDNITITPVGLIGFINKGAKGTKTIPFFSISTIQFKKSGLRNGYIRFTILGRKQNEVGVFNPVSDENTFTFTGNNELALQIKDYIEKRLLESRKPLTFSSSSSVADELLKLSDMVTKGILSEEEFQSLKRRLIS
jgi:hypothetical protein